MPDDLDDIESEDLHLASGMLVDLDDTGKSLARYLIFYSQIRVKLENPDFEKTFDVYSTDQIEARYLLSPSMMERLLALDREFNKNITISFRDSNILIAIPESRNHFEASIWKPMDDLSQLKNDFSMIHALVSIVEDLNLNTRIWSKK